MTDDRSFSLDELSSLAGLPRRTVRYYIQMGLVDRPEGETRAARYGQRHLEQLLAVKRWASAGLALEKIREALASEQQPELPSRPRPPGSVEVWSHLVLADGVELTIEPGRAGFSPEQLRELMRRTMQALEEIQKGKAK